MKRNPNDSDAPSQPEHSLPMDIELLKAEEWLTSTELMSYLGISRSTLYRWSSNKQLPSIKMGGTMFYPKHLISQLFVNQALRKLDDVLMRLSVMVSP